MNAKLAIRPMRPGDTQALREHFIRHRAESGRDGIHFMPYEAHANEGPSGANLDALKLALDQPGWQRWFVAENAAGQIIGHLDLRGDRLSSANHRCTLGIGIEQAYRGQGLGQRLIQQALEFARCHSHLVWMELWVFGHNAPAIALYQRMGFETVGTTEDQFRLDGESIDDIHMVLKL